IAATHSGSSHISTLPSFLDDIVSSSFSTFSTIETLIFGSNRSFENVLIAPRLTSFTLFCFGVDIAIKHDKPFSINNGSFSGVISLSNSDSRPSFSAINCFDSASMAMDFKTLTDAILESELPCCKTRSRESKQSHLLSPSRCFFTIETKSNAFTTSSRTSTPPLTLRSKSTSLATKPSIFTRKSRFSSESNAKRTIFMSGSTRLFPSTSTTADLHGGWTRVVTVVEPALDAGAVVGYSGAETDRGFHHVEKPEEQNSESGNREREREVMVYGQRESGFIALDTGGFWTFGYVGTLSKGFWRSDEDRWITPEVL
ncbi:hypothetical protein Lal_00006463, partial [Lupinus albus]